MGLRRCRSQTIECLKKQILIRNMQRFEEFVDNTIEEDWLFQCPKGQQIKVNHSRKHEFYSNVPYQDKSGHVKTSNGCGSLDLIFDDSENSLIHVEKEFRWTSILLFSVRTF